MYGLGAKVSEIFKVRGQIMYFLVNTPLPKLMDIATPNFVGAQFT